LSNQIKVQGEPYLKDLITEYNNVNQVAVVEQNLGIYCLEVNKPSPSDNLVPSSCPTPAIANKQPETKCWILIFDGSKSKMGAGAEVELQNPKGKKYQASFRLEFPCTCNLAEYEALVQGMRMALAKGVENLLVMGDSELVVQQIKGQYECKDDCLA